MAEDDLAASTAPAGPPVEIVVHVESDARACSASAEVGTLDDGTSLPAGTVERLACDAAVVTVIEDRHGVPLDVGRRRRTIPAALRRALQLRDRWCIHPGCTNRRVDGHHVTPWSRGGATKLANLASLFDSRTSLPRWDGTPPDHDHIVQTIATNHPPPPVCRSGATASLVVPVVRGSRGRPRS